MWNCGCPLLVLGKNQQGTTTIPQTRTITVSQQASDTGPQTLKTTTISHGPKNNNQLKMWVSSSRRIQIENTFSPNPVSTVADHQTPATQVQQSPPLHRSRSITHPTGPSEPAYRAHRSRPTAPQLHTDGSIGARPTGPQVHIGARPTGPSEPAPRVHRPHNPLNPEINQLGNGHVDFNRSKGTLTQRTQVLTLPRIPRSH